MKKKILRLLLFVVIAYLIYAVVMMAYLFVTQRNLFKVSNNRMEPTLSEGAVVRYQTDFSELERGDLVVYQDPNRFIADVARVVAIANDSVQIANSTLSVNGESVVQHERYERYDNQVITLGEKEVFLLRDNRESGGLVLGGYEPVRYDEIRGKVTECLNCELEL